MLIQAVVQKQKNTRLHRAHARMMTGVLLFKTRTKLLFRTTVRGGGRKFLVLRILQHGHSPPQRRDRNVKKIIAEKSELRAGNFFVVWNYDLYTSRR